ncbi:MAG: potassium-transporting ATPase subunit KdpC [Alphaproteobacteria bacterium]|nr:potassium-transporting ATPase subunit KdpC [Alphaproteobacteria bacterium]MBV8547962.1 potassium-transporting ATPase subunit KdpC [Alphaproteobacteria bacterium]
MRGQLRASLALLVLMTVLTGILYPLAIWGIGQSFFPYQAEGSLIVANGKVIGSDLIGQNFAGDTYFHSRPSAAGNGYDATQSGGSNLATGSDDLIKQVKERIQAIRATGFTGGIPVDAVTGSGSGLDPDISVANARLQAQHVAQSRHMDVGVINNLIAENTRERDWHVFGETRINVLQLNRALDNLANH